VTGEIVVVNTCAFIADAQQEAIDTIIRLGEQKKEGRIGQLFVMGCLPQKFREELQIELPEVDRFYGKFEWEKIIEDIGKMPDANELRKLATPKHYAYLKIAEGCDRTCSFCTIPGITGKYRSRTQEDILRETRQLVEQGVKEILLVAQDLTYYGMDIYRKQMLPQLVEEIANVPGVEWIKLHYAYPTHFPMELLKMMNEYPNVCKYLDIALQHASDHMLRVMRRNITQKETIQLIEKIRQEVIGIKIRTTMMVGHPEETAQDFQELIRFVENMRFERLGTFKYSHEIGTFAYQNYQDNVNDSDKNIRLNQLMKVQKSIAYQQNQAEIGKIYTVIVDSEEKSYFKTRSQFDSPNVDQHVFVAKNQALSLGQLCQVKIFSAAHYDLYAKSLG
jgi:ribosomal protein S12 methylthiotransferase